jgi:hypothetical protein
MTITSYSFLELVRFLMAGLLLHFECVFGSLSHPVGAGLLIPSRRKQLLSAQHRIRNDERRRVWDSRHGQDFQTQRSSARCRSRLRFRTSLSSTAVLANSALIVRQPTAPVILNTGGTSFRDPQNRFFMMIPIKCESLGLAEFLHLEYRTAILE